MSAISKYNTNVLVLIWSALFMFFSSKYFLINGAYIEFTPMLMSRNILKTFKIYPISTSSSGVEYNFAKCKKPKLEAQPRALIENRFKTFLSSLVLKKLNLKSNPNKLELFKMIKTMSRPKAFPRKKATTIFLRISINMMIHKNEIKNNA
jgi:hypothetical protein